jgi:lysylphosphatidylglycerol synthetase-like protein (DUF2156 family)
MVKLKIAFTFAMLACILTAVCALAEQARIVTILYRMAVSMLLFGFLGYFSIDFIQQQVERKLRGRTEPGQKINISQNPQTDKLGPVGQKTSFSPLTAENLERITEMK